MAYVSYKNKRILGCSKRKPSTGSFIEMPMSDFTAMQNALSAHECLQVVNKNLVTVEAVPNGHVIDGGELRPKTRQELIDEMHTSERKQYLNTESRQNRLKEYPAIGDQLDALMKWIFSRPDEDFTPELNSLAAKCMSVKSKYPLED